MQLDVSDERLQLAMTFLEGEGWSFLFTRKNLVLVTAPDCPPCIWDRRDVVGRARLCASRKQKTRRSCAG